VGRARKAFVLAVFSACWIVASPVLPAFAQSVNVLLPEVVDKSDRVKAATADLAAARFKARKALGAWFPTAEQTLDQGTQSILQHETARTSTGFTNYDLKFTQLLWDFGKTNAAIRQSALEVTRAENALAQARREVISDAVKAYANLMRTNEVLGFARQSRENISKQTGLEEARVETGSGLSTDVLQAKTQLAGAEARVITAEGQLTAAENKFYTSFQMDPPDVANMQRIEVPTDRLPATLEDALRLALDNNTRLKQARLDEEVARQDVRSVIGGELAPKITGVLERKLENNVDGTLNFKQDTVAKVELNMPFNLAGAAFDSLDAAKANVQSKTRTVADLTRTVTEEVKNSWSALRTAQRNAQSQQNQADIAAAFLELARKEQQLGNRSLIDVLSGETSLINALSDAASSKVDALIAAFDLLNATGLLDYDVFGLTP
jgi:adhesin transport system outer membrane protein